MPDSGHSTDSQADSPADYARAGAKLVLALECCDIFYELLSPSRLEIVSIFFCRIYTAPYTLG